ncbi:putative branched-chain amino acid transport protein AzlC [Caenispirillum salinarum AK4]|uniref:Putative branched-chain amino acid transport protein AzlC n=2 Tax=Caenispirillum TaxID=414051 RepID=K9GRG3_9PROT|nr:putative branched-chain amino acid transport protein AzlC [Caenispirillum salinarum AK4]
MRNGISARAVLRGGKEAAPLSLVYFVFSASFGNFAVSEMGLPPWYAAGTTILTYGIQAQIAAFKAMLAGENILWIAALVLAINMRFLLMSAAMAPRLKGLPMLYQIGAAHLVANGSFAAAVRHERSTGCRTAGYFLGFALTVYGVFACGALAGSMIGGTLSPQLQEVTAFVLPAFLLAMVASGIPHQRVFMPLMMSVSALLTLFLAYWLSPSAALLLGPAIVATGVEGVRHVRNG